MISVPTVKGELIMNDRLNIGGINYEAEYHRLTAEMGNLMEEHEFLRNELRIKENKLAYYAGFEAACKMLLKECFEGE